MVYFIIGYILGIISGILGIALFLYIIFKDFFKK